jgi:WD40 repeat protein/ABC-type oligopeptide transport system ATPase subunit
MLNKPLPSDAPEKYASEVIEPEPGTLNPFPGLRPFSVDECHLFFGREGQVDDVLIKLSQNRFVTVLGYSGSGKSSMMSCGLVPVLYGGFMTENGPHWNVIITRPGSSPIKNLTRSIVNFLISSGRIVAEDADIHHAIINSVLRSGPEGLIEVARYLQSSKNENIFFLIDQFEEVFRFQESDDNEEAHNDAHLFVNFILKAVSQTDIPAYVALTMRSDFIGYCSVFPGLTHLVNNSNYLVPQMMREQKKMAIEGPIAVAGGRISQRLVRRLLSDAGNFQDQLPILQHALMRTWDYWLVNRESGEPIDVRHYNAVGKITEALSQHANEAYDELTTRQKEIAEVLFKTITEKNQENKGLRRPGRLGLIAALAEAEEQDVIDVVDHFRKGGRSFLMPAAHIPLSADSIIELSHESLMRIWTRLKAWVEEESESAQMYKRLSDAAAMYQIGKTGLWRPPDLQLALNWQRKQKPTREWGQRYDEAFERAIVFLDTSRITYEAELKNQEMLQRRVLRRTRATAIILGVAFVVAILFFVYAYIQQLQAQQAEAAATIAKEEAIAAKDIAEKNRILADEQTKLATRKSEELVKSNEALTDALASTEREKARAEGALEQAREEREKAVVASENERDARVEAEKQTGIAKDQTSKALRLFMLAKAQEFATKSVQEEDDKDLAGLLAMEGYILHRRFEGRRYDPYIYNGLYSSLTKLNGNNYNAIKAQGPPHVHIKSLIVSSKSDKFYTSGVDGRILVGDSENLKSTPTGYSTAYPSKVIAMSKDETYLINGSDSSFVQIYDLRSSKTRPLAVVRGLPGGTNSMAFLPDNSGFIVASTGKTLSFVNHLTGEVKQLLKLPTEIKAISISPDGKTLAGATWTGQLIMINLETNTPTTLLDDNMSRILSVKFNPAGDKVAIGVEERFITEQGNKVRGLVKLYDLKTNQTRQFTGHLSGVTDVEFSPDNKLLASAGLDKRLIMWVLDNPEDLPIVMSNNNGFIWDISFTRASNYLIAACSESEIRVWPTDPSILGEQICPKLTRNMTQDEWKKYAGDSDDLKYETTCARLLIKDN